MQTKVKLSRRIYTPKITVISSLPTKGEHLYAKYKYLINIHVHVGLYKIMSHVFRFVKRIGYNNVIIMCLQF